VISLELLYHFSCKSCEGWWSIAVENFMGAGDREWFCPWCGDKELHDEGNFPVGRKVPTQKDN